MLVGEGEGGALLCIVRNSYQTLRKKNTQLELNIQQEEICTKILDLAYTIALTSS